MISRNEGLEKYEHVEVSIGATGIIILQYFRLMGGPDQLTKHFSGFLMGHWPQKGPAIGHQPTNI